LNHFHAIDYGRFLESLQQFGQIHDLPGQAFLVKLLSNPSAVRGRPLAAKGAQTSMSFELAEEIGR
jgi:hypothetical protein